MFSWTRIEAVLSRSDSGKLDKCSKCRPKFYVWSYIEGLLDNSLLSVGRNLTEAIKIIMILDVC